MITKREPRDDAEAVQWHEWDVVARDAAAATVADSAPDEEIEAVCAWISCFDDDVETTCSKCGRAIVRRPWHEARVVFVCVACHDPALALALAVGGL